MRTVRELIALYEITVRSAEYLKSSGEIKIRRGIELLKESDKQYQECQNISQQIKSISEKGEIYEMDSKRI